MPGKSTAGQRRWIRKENIKWLILFFVIAFAVRITLSAMYVPSENPLTDQHAYLRFNQEFFENGINKETRLSTFIMAPLMLFFSWFGFSYLTSTIIAGCLISALTIIPLWLIAEHLKIYPKLVCFLYVFSSFEIIRILSIGSYTTEFGILFLTLYILLLLKGYCRIAPFVFIIPFFSHKSSPLFIYLFLAFALIFSVAKYRSILNKEAKKWIMWSIIIFVIFGAIRFGIINPSLASNTETILSTQVAENAPRILMQPFHDYIEVAGSYILILALLGLVWFYRENKDSIITQSWVYAPQLLSFVPLFTNVEVSARVAAYGAPSMCLLAAYAFRNWSKKHLIMKIFLALMVIGAVYYTVSFSMFQFYQHSVLVLG